MKGKNESSSGKGSNLFVCREVAGEGKTSRLVCTNNQSRDDGNSCKKTHDYIIVGLGTSGAVLARYLSDDTRNDVLVLESGRNRTDDPVVSSGPFTINQTEIANSSKYSVTKKCPEKTPLAGAFPNVDFGAGRMWFGSSAHNYQLAVRGSSDRWNQLASLVGSTQWTYNNLVPYFKFLETYNGISQQPTLRGYTGPLEITPLPDIPSTLSLATSAATDSPRVPDYNVPSGNISVAPAQFFSDEAFTQRYFAYHFLPISVLTPDGRGVGTRKLQVKSGAHANKVLFDGNVAIGVEYLQNGVTKRRYARKKVILCAGDPFSAQILQLSGIGDPAVLSSPHVNIPVKFANPRVGTGLKTHYGPMLLAVTTPEQQPPVPVLAHTNATPYYQPAVPGDGIRRATLLFLTPVAAGPPPLLQASNTQETEPGVFGLGWNLRPRSSGTAYIVDKNPLTMPDIRFNFYSDGGLDDPASDISMSVALLKSMRDCVTTNGMNAEIVFPPPPHFASDAELAQDAGAVLHHSAMGSVTNHYSGTCSMGTSPANGVVSGKTLHVFGVQNLMVVDNSVHPFPTTGNTALQAYVTGLIAAKILGEDPVF